MVLEREANQQTSYLFYFQIAGIRRYVKNVVQSSVYGLTFTSSKHCCTKTSKLNTNTRTQPLPKKLWNNLDWTATVEKTHSAWLFPKPFNGENRRVTAKKTNSTYLEILNICENERVYSLTWLTPCHDCSSFLELRLANAQEAGKRSLHSIFFDAVDNYADFLCVHTSFSESNVMERELQFQDFPSDIAPSGLPSSSERDGNLKANSLFIPESAEKSPPLFSLQFCQQFFDVDTAVVIRRVLYSMVPRLNMNFITQSIRPHPDLFGPFWIALTLLFTACVGNQLGEMFNAIHGDGTVRHAVLNFRIGKPFVQFLNSYLLSLSQITLMASVIFAYAFLVPGLFIVFFIWRNMDDMYTLLELICSYGYSLSVFIPISLLWAINIQWFRWLLTLFGVFLSGGVLLLSIWPVVRKHSRLVCKMFTAPIIGAYLNSITSFGVLACMLATHLAMAVFLMVCTGSSTSPLDAQTTVTTITDQAFMHQWSAVSLNTNVSALRFTPQGDILAVAYANGVVRCFQVASGQEVATISTSERPSACNDVCWYPTGHYLFAAKEDGTVIMHDYRMGKLHSASMCHSVAVDSTIRFWDLRSVSPLLTVSSSGGAIYTMDCDSSGMRLATGGADGLIHICDATTGAVFDVICGEFNRTPITSVNFSMDGLYLLVSRQEWPVKLWKVSNKTAIRKFIGSKNLYYVIRSKLLGRYVISGSEDGRVFVWDCDSTDVVARLPHKPAVLTVDGCDKQQMLLASASVAGVYMWRQRKRKAPKVDIPMYNVQQVVTKTLDQQLDAPIEHKNLPSDRIQSTDVLCKSSDLFASIEFDALLGEGTFGCIYRAKCSAPGFEKFVAVKTMKGFNGSEAKEHLVKEIELLSRLPKHPNVTEFLGYCDRPGLLLLILEYCPQGNLKRFLKTNDPRCHPEGFEITNFLPPALYYGRQIALGMEHLNAHNLVHRDLAARNILVSDGRPFVRLRKCMLRCSGGKTVKVSDFGLSRSGAIYLQMVGGRLPVRWMAPESIFVRMFSNKSDVWSFGIVLWEIVTVDLNPYPGVDIAQLFHFLKMGYRMEKPENCSQALYSVMMRCWNTRPECRPSFTELREEIEALLPLCTVNTPSC
ncbi:LOW QUALITY PROTEIN: hypothetical protein M514_19246 [Trichuris suis]|uniref:Protein kinase domain-containing protein n=1 Tax=Trichuris suis TaxID=68888 RepID=A0A085NGL7_9BILA|nr:LOW QUALITY PROTEIN: hypothetical protein M514_19246 [Trichuris suis]